MALAFLRVSTVNRFCMARLCARAGRVTAQHGGFPARAAAAEPAAEEGAAAEAAAPRRASPRNKKVGLRDLDQATSTVCRCTVCVEGGF